MNIFNKKTILFFSISTLMINGCVAKNEFETKSPKRIVVVSKPVKTKAIWAKKLALNTKKDDCIDCYATPILKKSTKSSYKVDKVIDTKYYGAYDYTETASDRNLKTPNKYVSATSSVNSAYGRYSTTLNTAIQVGAFRKYSGAKIYKKRYNALSDRYKVTIKTASKNNKPLYRVRIEGFKNKVEAKRFMDSYGIRNAFLVRK